jgi:hypothetical protein
MVLWVGFEDAVPVAGWIVLALVVPGLLLTRLIGFGRTDALGAAVAAVFFSICVLVLAGIWLHRAGTLDRAGWVKALVVVSLWLAVPLGVIRLVNWAEGAAASVRRRGGPRLGALHVACLACAAVLAFSALLSARDGALAHKQFSYTQFWMLPARDDPAAITIGVSNREKERVSYSLDLMVDGNLLNHVEGIRLEDGGLWTQDFSLSLDPDARGTVEAWLFRSDQPDLIYRRAIQRMRPAAGAAGALAVQ